MSKQKRKTKTLVITDDEEGEELNPFSFREFIRSKNQNQNTDLEQSDTLTATKKTNSGSQSRLDPRKITFDPEIRCSFFPEPSVSMVMQQEQQENFRLLPPHSEEDSSSSLWLPDEEEEEEEEEEMRLSCRAAVSRTSAGGREEGENYEGDDETSMAAPPISCRSSRSSQLQKLKEENVALRRTIKELQKKSDASEQRALQLSEELRQRRREEEKEARELENMVLSVEQNLHLMTKRAVKAENSVTILRLEVQHLQGQAEAYRSEVEHLKAAEMEVVKTMRQNAQLASEYLSQAASQAQSSIKQLLGGAETLSLVSQMLQSIDKISDLHAEL